MHSSSLFASCALALTVSTAQDNFPYQPCPLLRAYYPAPTINSSSALIQGISAEFTDKFDKLVATGLSDDFGSITPNTTSFSVVLYSGAADTDQDPIFFEYHHKADQVTQPGQISLDTVFPLGSLTQLFTVYTWLVRMGGGWETPITHFLPELNTNQTPDLSVKWDVVTVGALAGQMSGIARNSFACNVGESCDFQDFASKFASSIPYSLPDTTPIESNAAFQLLAFALEHASCPHQDFATIVSHSLAQPLQLNGTSLLSVAAESTVFAQGILANTTGEPAALGLLSTPRDLARLGHAMLTSRLVSPALTRRWLQPVADTSNLRNGVGRPWEIYHAGQYANSSILDVYAKTGSLGAYSSYFGLAPDLNAGFAILAHDTTGTAPDLNVYADYVSVAVDLIEELAGQQAAAGFTGNFTDATTGDVAELDASDGPGIVVTSLVVNGVDLRKATAAAANIKVDNLDLRLYPSNVVSGTQQVFVIVFQDRTAPVDQETPTCITWQEVGSLGAGIVDRVVMVLGEDGSAKSVTIPGSVVGGKSTTLARAS